MLYATKIISWYTQWINSNEFNDNSSQETSISLVIAFKDEEHNIRQLIESLKAQTLTSWELILVNDHSTDNGEAIAQKHLCNYPIDAQIIQSEKHGKKAALQQGVKLAKHPVIVTTDADCTFQPNWLKTLTAFYNSNDADLVIAPVAIKRTKGLLNRFQQVDFIALQLSGGASALRQQAIMCNGANLMFNRDLYLKAQLQPKVASGDDMFLLEWMKLQSKNIAFIKSKQALVETQPVTTLHQFFQQRARWALKAPHYKDKQIITTGLIVSSLNGLLFLCLTGGFWFPALWPVFGISLTIKSVCDYLLLKSGSKDFNFNISLFEVVLMQLIYPFYVVSVILFPIFNNIQWKQRDI